MNRSKFFSTVAALLFAIAGAFAQEKETVFVDASVFPLYGKCIENTSGRYERLPLAYKDISREALWNLGRNSAGLYVRFRSNSTTITARWKPTKHHMAHMTDVGDNGLDLYILTGKDGWRFAGSGFLWKETEVRTKKLVKDMDPVMREFMLYLPLYTNLESLELGFDEGSVFEGPAVQSPKSGSPIVMYGSSILQGGCANRPGMAFTAIIGRRLDREVINLGFSGNAKLDYEIAELMAQVENPAVFVLDYVPNSSVDRIEERGEKFFRILRDKHPSVPVVFVEDPTYPHSRFDNRIRKEVETRNAAQKALFLKLKKAGEKKLYYVSTKGMIGDDGEATVDGVHFTDLGMMRYTDHILPVLKKALR